MELSYTQRQEISKNGYVIVPGLIPKVMVDNVVKAINHSMGQGMNKEDIAVFAQQSYCPELSGDPVVTDILHKTPIWSMAESVIGKGNIKPNGDRGQIALRFPVIQDPPEAPRPHLDGMYTPLNGVPKGTISNFTMLIGVLLSDLPEPYAGNFTVWPGSHHLYEKYFQEHGAEALFNGMPKIDLPEPVQVTGKAGDVVFCHYQLGHGITMNVSPHIRYAMFFRMTHIDLDPSTNWKDPMEDIWLHWPGIGR